MERKLVMILVSINQIVGNWIRSTTEPLIAANSDHVFRSAISPPDRPSDRQGSARFRP
jgi:hypothetical protein